MGVDRNLCKVAIAAGIVTVCALHKMQWRGDVAVLAMIVIFISSVVGQQLWASSFGFWCSVYRSGAFFVCQAVTVIFVTVVYRLSPWHPLASFPGPVINKITTIQLAYMVSTGKQHLIITDLHKKYGPFVRTGPNTLSISSLTAVPVIYNSAHCMNKSEAYRPGRLDAGGLFFLTDLRKHNERRKIWSGAFTASALDSASAVLSKRTHELVSCMAKRQQNGVVDLCLCIQHWSYDVMGDLTFGGSSRIELMQDGDQKKLVSAGQDATSFFEVLGHVPTLFDIMTRLPMAKDLRSLQQLSLELLEARRRVDVQDASPDICSHLLLKDVNSGSAQLNNTELNLDALFAIQAGSDTTSSVLTLVFYHILANDRVYERLRDELRETFLEELTPADHPTLSRLPYLSAIVTEGLRLSSPFPGFPRVVPEGGVSIDGVFIPGGTIVGVPVWTVHIDPTNFWPMPETFVPERWLEGGLGEVSITRKNAILSFSLGPFGCLGKNLAMKELHVVIAQLLLSYDMRLSSQFDRTRFRDGIKNKRATLFMYPLMVEITPVERVTSS